jgi:AraC-like DNA-binding protein
MATQDHICYSPRTGFYSPTARVDIKRDNPERFEYCWQGSGDFGNLRFSRTKIRPGFDIWTSDALLRENVSFSLVEHPAILNFGFCLSGKSLAKYGTRREPIKFSTGTQGVFYCPYTYGTACMSMGVPQRQVEIIFTPERLRSYFESDPDAIPPIFREILAEKQNDPIYQLQTITPAMRSALEQLIDCPFRGITRKFFFESRALELIAHQLRQLSENSPKRTTGSFRLHAIDRKRAESARDLLVSRLENPPRLLQLAREAGMSHPKLNRCFREMYGMTVFQYLRNERLNQARQMLDQGLNVTETAYAVGYESISHFSRAFKMQFGASPSRRMGTI